MRIRRHRRFARQARLRVTKTDRPVCFAVSFSGDNLADQPFFDAVAFGKHPKGAMPDRGFLPEHRNVSVSGSTRAKVGFRGLACAKIASSAPRLL